MTTCSCGETVSRSIVSFLSFKWLHPSREDLLAKTHKELEKAISTTNAVFIELLGESGSGKSLVLHCVLAKLSAQSFKAFYFDCRDLGSNVLGNCAKQVLGGKVTKKDALKKLLNKAASNKGRYANIRNVLVFENASDLQQQSLNDLAELFLEANSPQLDTCNLVVVVETRSITAFDNKVSFVRVSFPPYSKDELAQLLVVEEYYSSIISRFPAEQAKRSACLR